MLCYLIMWCVWVEALVLLSPYGRRCNCSYWCAGVLLSPSCSFEVKKWPWRSAWRSLLCSSSEIKRTAALWILMSRRALKVGRPHWRRARLQGFLIIATNPAPAVHGGHGKDQGFAFHRPIINRVIPPNDFAVAIQCLETTFKISPSDCHLAVPQPLTEIFLNSLLKVGTRCW